jgi:adenylate kinase family enzyme
MTLKIAFLISGHARNYIYTTFSFKKYVFDRCKNADIFISFKENSRTHYSNEEINSIIKEYKIPIDDKINDSTYLNCMFGEKLKYFNYDNENYIQELVSNKLNSIEESIKDKISLGVLDQYARVKNIAEIFDNYTKENNVNYDVVIRLRIDKLWWVTNIDLERYLIDKNKLYFSYINWEKSKHNGLPNWIQDFFFMGEKNLMIYLMKDFFDKLYISSEFVNIYYLNKSPEIQFGEYVNSNKNIVNKIIVSEIRFNLYSLLVSRSSYLAGYFVGSKKDVYNALGKCLHLKKKYNI